MKNINNITKIKMDGRGIEIEQKLTNILLTTNSSTTKLLEAITGETVEINVLHQEITLKSELCSKYTEYIVQLESSDKYLKRIVSLVNNGKVLSDNIVIGSYENISDKVKVELIKGKIPLGKLIKNKETKRKLLWSGYLDKSFLNLHFDEQKFLLSRYPAKMYLIYIGEVSCFCLLEVFHIDEITKFFLG